MAKKKSTVPENETKQAKFKRVVIPRVNKALRAIELVGNQSGSAYAYTDKDIDVIVDALTDAVSAVEARYKGKGKADAGFKLT